MNPWFYCPMTACSVLVVIRIDLLLSGLIKNINSQYSASVEPKQQCAVAVATWNFHLKSKSFYAWDFISNLGCSKIWMFALRMFNWNALRWSLDSFCLNKIHYGFYPSFWSWFIIAIVEWALSSSLALRGSLYEQTLYHQNNQLLVGVVFMKMH